MSAELRGLSIAFTVRTPDHLPKLPNGEQMYADDVSEELSDVVWAAVREWYASRGKDLLRCEPV